jgi:hypothetical protein
MARATTTKLAKYRFSQNHNVSKAKIGSKKFLLLFFGINTKSFLMIIYKGPNYQRGILLKLTGAI